ncbi:uncharacterized protein FOBCDRAFT_251175 [Fusarium oxysporum Fo47]|uniref:RRM domain-containing protein n=1 Tax=Fusarium oxysporum Fo47 TaxID=660027 RepID=W9K985_FUSOX|nr:uncharacterized protein FOBCDRAFT_251175 [Fusarium oxysporum Fo47]EWZ39249.1 hypothetical protein FOZG_08398 [Fusarium oxysporum Fo47]QKD55700.2 hypothetical protein FOBCDRAFT_251175 [Fusarium oxysporum Fo47]
MATRKRPRDVEEYDKYQGLVIYVGNVHYDANPVDFEHFLQDNGMSCTLYWPEAGERSHGGWCWARFHHHDHASYAINNLNGTIFCGRMLRTGHVATNSTFNPHTFFQDYNLLKYPGPSSHHYHRPAEHPGFYPSTKNLRPPAAPFRQSVNNEVQYPDCYPPKKTEHLNHRHIPKLQDVWEADKPFLNTANIFAKGIKISGLAITLYWQPGRVLGPNSQERSTISHSERFIRPADMSTNILSATCRSHIVSYKRPPGVGLGWGDFDRFYEWQLLGRKVQKSMVRAQRFQQSNSPHMSFISELTGCLHIVRTDSTKIESRRTLKKPNLWQKLKNSKN